MKSSLFSFLFVFSFLSFSQASWTYSYSFKLLDKYGNEFNGKHVVDNDISVFLLNNGSHIEQGGTFISAKNEVHVSAHTISTEGFMMIISGTDTTTIKLATHCINLGTFKISPGHYEVPFWGDDKHFSCQEHLSECRLTKNMSHFKKSDQPNTQDLSNLKKIELKLSR
ncbi:MAG: hypothetical protein R2799_12105 [Crocinitomicaceae bacterium]